MKIMILLAIAILLLNVSSAGSTEKRIMQVSSDGTTVTFDDGSVYKIEPWATTRTFRWLVGDRVNIRDNKLDEWYRVPIGDPSAGSAVPATRIR